MFKITCKFTTDKGTLKGGSVIDRKELDKHFTKKEQKTYMDAGLIAGISVHTSGKDSEKTLEELLETEDKNSLKSSELDTVLEHYGLDKTGNKSKKVENIHAFEEALDGDISELDDAMLLQVAVYCKVDATLEREEMVEAIEEALGE